MGRCCDCRWKSLCRFGLWLTTKFSRASLFMPPMCGCDSCGTVSKFVVYLFGVNLDSDGVLFLHLGAHLPQIWQRLPAGFDRTAPGNAVTFARRRQAVWDNLQWQLQKLNIKTCRLHTHCVGPLQWWKNSGSRFDSFLLFETFHAANSWNSPWQGIIGYFAQFQAVWCTMGSRADYTNNDKSLWWIPMPCGRTFFAKLSKVIGKQQKVNDKYRQQ